MRSAAPQEDQFIWLLTTVGSTIISLYLRFAFMPLYHENVAAGRAGLSVFGLDTWAGWALIAAPWPLLVVGMARKDAWAKVAGGTALLVAVGWLIIITAHATGTSSVTQ